MKANPLVIAVPVLAALGGLVYYTTENPPVEEDETIAIIDVEEDDVQQATVTKPTGEKITVLRGEDGEWGFGPPLTIPADDSAIGLMITNLASMDADRLVEEEVSEWGAFGLAGDGSLSVEMQPKEGAPVKVIFGDDTPTGSGLFARIEGDPQLFTVFNYVKSSFEKEVFDWRRKRLVDVDGDKVSRVKVTAGARTVEFGKSGDDWQILNPGPLRADNFTVGDLARSAYDAEMTAVLAEGEDNSQYSFARPYAKVEIVDDKGSHELTIAKNSSGTYYASSSDLEGGVYEISSTTAEGFDKPVEDLRNKKLFDFGFSGIASLNVTAGDLSVTVEKREDDWVLTSENNRVADSEKAQTLIDSLRNLTAISFPSDAAAAQSRYGLSSPTIEAEVMLDEEGAEPEKVVVSDLSKERVYAARAGEASTYEIEKAPAEEIRRAVEEILRVEEEEPESDDEESDQG